MPGHAAAAPAGPGHGAARSGPALVAEQSATALKAARASHQPVEIPALTSATAKSYVNPDGTMTVKQSLLPQRAWHNGAWHDLDASLVANADGTLSPRMAAAGLVLSGGGQRPLATMRSLGHELSIGWPTRLPKPTVSGATATYAEVLAGVDLVVTASDQGGFSDTLVVKTPQAAANPQLAQLTMSTSSDGLAISTDAAGGIHARAGAHGMPIFNADAPVMWDSAASAAPAGRAAGKATAAAPRSSVFAPGARAHRAPIKASAASGALVRSAQGARRSGSITLVPDRRLLTGRSTVFPVYIDPTWTDNPAGSSVQATAEVMDHFPSQEYPNPGTLQLGYCGWDTCYVNPGGIQATFVARSLLRMQVPTQLHNNARIFSSELNITFKYGPYSSCSGAPTPKINLGWIDAFSSSTNWNNQPSWKQTVASASPAACSGARAAFDLTSFMGSHANSASSLSFELRADNPSDKDTWKQFTKAGISMETHFDHAPSLPSRSATSPGGICQTGAPGKVVIGNDDVTLETVASDLDGGQLGTEFVVKNYGGATVYDSGDPAKATTSLTSTSGSVVRTTIKRDTIWSWHTDGKTKAYPYSWYVVTSDGKLTSPSTGTGTAGTPCTFTFDPTQPGAPGVDAATNDGHDALGDPPATLTLAPCAAKLTDATATCPGTAPNRYKIQVNSGPPSTVIATGGVQTTALPLTHVGPNTVTVYAMSVAGNLSSAPGADTFVVNGPATAFADGDYNGDAAKQPDVLTVGTTTNPGLWLATRDGSGATGTAVDIGAAGTGISDPGSPADWSGAQVLHGDFTGHHVQDVLAYYPSGTHAGAGAVLYGSGDTNPLLPTSGNQDNIQAGSLSDSTLNALGDDPDQLVAVGTAGHLDPPSGIADLIGISGDTDNGYALNLYAANPGAGASSYQFSSQLAGVADTPDQVQGSSWNDFTLVAAQPAGETVLFAVKKSTGQIWESQRPSDGSKTIGMPGTWSTSPLSAPWGSTPPKLIYGDVNAAGQVELWAQNGTTVTPYLLSGTTLKAGAAVNLLTPGHEWPLSSLTGPSASCTATVCTPDTRGGTDAPVTGGVTVDDDEVLGKVADFGGNGYLTLPQNLLHSSTTLTLSMAFRADPGKHGILFSTATATPDKLPAGSMPVLYIGSDGRLYGQFWNGYVRPMISPQRVDDGEWHTITLSGQGSIQSFYLDNDIRIGMAGSDQISNGDALNFVGGGVFPPNTSTKVWINPPVKTDGVTASQPSYFSGDIANVVYYNKYLSNDQLTPYWQPSPMVGPITSAVNAGLCLDDAGGKKADGDAVQIYTCNNSAAQNWSINPDGSVRINGTTKCLAVAGGATTSGAKAILWECGTPLPTGAQLWHLDSSGQIWNPQAQMCLDDPGQSTTSGTQLQIYTCNESKAQYWIIP